MSHKETFLTIRAGSRVWPQAACLAASSLSGEGCLQLGQQWRPCHQAGPGFLLSVLFTSHTSSASGPHHPPPPSFPQRPPRGWRMLPPINHRGNSRWLSLGLGRGQRLWTSHFYSPAAWSCLEAHACLALARPGWGHRRVVPWWLLFCTVCFLTSRLIYL